MFTPGDEPPSFANVRRREGIGGEYRQLELGLVDGARGDDVDLHEPARPQPDDLDELLALADLGSDDILA